MQYFPSTLYESRSHPRQCRLHDCSSEACRPCHTLPPFSECILQCGNPDPRQTSTCGRKQPPPFRQALSQFLQKLHSITCVSEPPSASCMRCHDTRLRHAHEDWAHARVCLWVMLVLSVVIISVKLTRFFSQAKRALFGGCRKTLMGANLMFAPFAGLLLMAYDRVLTPRIRS